MKFIHLGDLHLGRSLGDFDLIQDQKYILDEILKIAGEESVDAVLIAGDIYDKSIPSEAAVSLFDYFMRSLAVRKIHTFIISGNHDSEERLNFGSHLFESNHVYISAKYRGILYEKALEDEKGEVHVFLLPFVKASQVRHFFPEEQIDSYDKAVRVVLSHADIDHSARNILVAHQFVAGQGTDPQPGGSEGLAVRSVGAVEKISWECFSDFDYVALGHIHSPQRVGREQIRYSGSPLKYSLSEAGSNKSVPIVTILEKGHVDIQLKPLKPLRDLRHLKGTAEELLSPENISSPDDYIYVTLTQEEIVDGAMGLFQKHYPNTVKIDYDNIYTRQSGPADIAKIVQNRSFEELISDFYHLMYDREMEEEELKIIKQIAAEAGVIHAAD